MNKHIYFTLLFIIISFYHVKTMNIDATRILFQVMIKD